MICFLVEDSLLGIVVFVRNTEELETGTQIPTLVLSSLSKRMVSAQALTGLSYTSTTGFIYFWFLYYNTAMRGERGENDKQNKIIGKNI